MTHKLPKCGYAWMFEPILMDFSWHILSAERSLCLNVETTNMHGGGDQTLENSKNFEKFKFE